MKIVVRIYGNLNAVQKADLPAVPEFLTAEYVKDIWNGGGLPPPVTPPSHEAKGVTKKHLMSRACDIFLSEHKEQLKAVVQHRPYPSRRELLKAWRKLGCYRFRMLSESSRLEYVAKAREGRLKVRSPSGRWESFSLSSGSKDALLPSDKKQKAKRGTTNKSQLAKFGAAVLGRLETNIATSRSAKDKLLQRRLYTMACKDSGFKYRTARRWLNGQGGGKWLWNHEDGIVDKLKKPSTGRKRLLDDQSLNFLLLPQTQERSKWSFKTKQPMRCLTGTKRQILLKSENLHRIYSYRQFCRRLRCGKLGIGTCANWTDRCEFCHMYDTVYKKNIRHEIEVFYGRATALKPGFFEAFQTFIETKAEWKESNFEAEASVAYLEALTKHAKTIGAKQTKELKDLTQEFVNKFTGEEGFIEKSEQ